MKARKVDSYKYIFLTVILLTVIAISSLAISGQRISAVNFHHDYEEDIDLDLMGYQWEEGDPGNTILVMISSDFSHSGNNSLVIESYAFESITYLDIPLNLDFATNTYFSLYFYSYGYRLSTIRISFTDAFGRSLSLDYKLTDIMLWESDTVFTMDSNLFEDKWSHLSRNLVDDITYAVNYENSSYADGYAAIQITNLRIYQPFDDGLHVNFIDDLTFSSTPIADIVYDGKDDISKYRNVGNVDPLSFRNENRAQLPINLAPEPVDSELSFPVDWIAVGTFFGVPLLVSLPIVFMLWRSPSPNKKLISLYPQAYRKN